MERWLWTQKQDIGPSPRSGHTMTYDSEKQKVLLFGGRAVGELNDTWEWDGNVWGQVADTGPSARTFSAMAFDPLRKKAVLFGGLNGQNGQNLNDTWEWDGNEWTQVGDTGPSSRRAHAMVYDSIEKTVVLFGGYSQIQGNDIFYGDTWEWDGTDWTLIAETGPPGRTYHSMAYNESEQNVVLYSGAASGQPIPGDTWLLQDKKWKKAQDIGPGSLSQSSMVYTSHGVVLFGGSYTDNNQTSDNTWVWDGKYWTQRQDIGPSHRRLHSMAYDAQRERVVLFGGATSPPGVKYYGDTWELRIETGPE